MRRMMLSSVRPSLPSTYWLGLLATSAIVLSLAAPAEAAGAMNRKARSIPSWYVGLSGSVNFVDDADVTETNVVTPSSGSFSFDDGYGLSAALGYRPRYTGSLLDNMRFEAELGVLDNEISRFTSTGSTQPISGDIQVRKIMANAFFDLDLSRQWRPYIGGGVGMAEVKTETDTDTVLAYQGMTGLYYTPLSFPIAEFGFGYRYFVTDDAEFSNGSTGLVQFEYEAHAIEAGMRLYF